MRWCCCSQSLLLLVAVTTAFICPSFAAESGEDEYRLVFSEGLAWPDKGSMQFYIGARRQGALGDLNDAEAHYAVVQRMLDASSHPSGTDEQPSVATVARLRAILTARRAELEELAGAGMEGAEKAATGAKEVQLYGEALSVCIQGGEQLACDHEWVGWGFGSCCAIAGALGRALQRLHPVGSEGRTETLRALALGRRLTTRFGGSPFTGGSLGSLGTSRTLGERGRKGKGADSGGRRRKKVVLLTAVSGAYHVFVQPLITSARKFFLKGIADLEVVVVSDRLPSYSPGNPEQVGVTWVGRPDLGWPLTAMMRYRSFLDAWHLIGHADYAFSIDVDCLFVAPVGYEILGRTVATTHADNVYYTGVEVMGPNRTIASTTHLPKGKMWLQSDIFRLRGEARKRGAGESRRPVGFEPGPAVYETGRRWPGGVRSLADIPEGDGERYYYSGFIGGEVDGMREILEGVVHATETDFANGVIAMVHDESHVNRFWVDHPPEIILTAAYMYPEAALFENLLCLPERICPRDHHHPWLWSPWHSEKWDVEAGWTPALWNSTANFVPRILNLAKDKARLVAGDGGGARVRYRMFNTDMHTGPIADVGEVLRALGVEVHEESLSAHCHRKGTCATSLKVLTRDNAMMLGDHPELDDAAGLAVTRRLQAAVFDAYKSGGGPADADMVMCAHPASLCEAFLPLGRAIVVYLSTRLDLGRLHRKAALQRWVSTLQKISSRPDGAVVTNNLYDAAYVEYFTGIKPRVIPTLARPRSAPLPCPPPRTEVLIDACDSQRCPPFRQQGVASLIASFREAERLSGAGGDGPASGSGAGTDGPASGRESNQTKFVELRELYPAYGGRDLERHPAIVYLPYQVSVMSLQERLAAGIPAFAPSLDLLVKWHMQYGLVFERRADWQTAGSRRGSLIGAHPNASAHLKTMDPNDERDPKAVRFWLGLSDIYNTPGVLLFDSWAHLLALVRDTDLCKVSQGQRGAWGRREEEVHSAWQTLVSEITGGKLPGTRPVPSGTYEQVMAELYP